MVQTSAMLKPSTENLTDGAPSILDTDDLIWLEINGSSTVISCLDSEFTAW